VIVFIHFLVLPRTSVCLISFHVPFVSSHGIVSCTEWLLLVVAPEILGDRGDGHGKSVDFWCFGIMLFIMLTQEVCRHSGLI
jgi:hypothetical protein